MRKLMTCYFMSMMATAIATAMVTVLAAGCGPGSVESGPDGGGPGNACTGTEARCTGNTYQVCENGTFRDQEACAGACDPGLGCVACQPLGTVCQGDAVHQCDQNGAVGEVIETCDPGQCYGGACGGNGCAVGAELVYVVDNQYRLRSFDPRKLAMGADPFTLVGPLDCPTEQPAYSGWNDPPTPFSMSVDRNATAWVLYTSGEIFRVSTQDASCQATGFVRGQQGFELFGMGFVSEAPGSAEERLWIAGGPSNNGMLEIGDLGYIDPGTLQVTRVGALPDTGTNSPELTGTGDALLFGYYPGDTTATVVAAINKENASHDPAMTWTLPALGTDARAWAFAHWGGNFYIFVTTRDASGDNSQVHFFDRQLEELSVTLENLPYRIVGAGVSTCAPVVVE